jgi:hypothetical protein
MNEHRAKPPKMNMTRILCAAAFSLIVLPIRLGGPTAVCAQSPQGCSKPKLYVRVAFVKGVEEQLNRDYAFNTSEGWLSEVSDYIVRELRLCAGDVDVVPLEKAVFIDDKPETPREENAFNERVGGEYHLDFILGLAGAGGDSSARGLSLRDSYWSQAAVGDADIDGRYVAVGSAEYPDLHASINRAIRALGQGSLRSVIEQYEATHFFSLRDPQLNLRLLAPGFVSPEPGEQKLRIKAAGRDCRNRYGQGINLWFPAESSRGEIAPVVSTTIGQGKTDNTWRAKTGPNGEIEIEYALKRGDAATTESVGVEVAGHGQKRIRRTISFPAKTLRVEVSPERNRVAPGEKTRILVRLLKVDDKGQKEGVANRTLTLNVTGIKNGSLQPQGRVATDGNGVGTLIYTAGDADRKVRVEASYKPEGYETVFKGEASLNSGSYKVTVDLEFGSPYVPDGRMPIAALQMQVVFDEVFVEEGSADSPLPSFGDIDAGEGRGTFTKFELQDSWTSGPATNRERPRFVKGKEPPKSFGASLAMAADFVMPEEKPGTGKDARRQAPEKALMVFTTDMGRNAPWWGNSEGGTVLEDFRLEFEVPWRDLLAGKPVTLVLPYEGNDPEEKGRWTISFLPKR